MPRDVRIKGSAEDRTRARGELQGALLTAARELATELGGFDRVTIRLVADRVGYRAPVIYQYFGSRHGLLVAVVDRGFAELADRLTASQRGVRPEDGLLAAANANWDFAFEQPHLYRLMHGLLDIPFGTPDTPPAAMACFDILARIVAAAQPEHPAAELDSDAPVDLFWAHLHGLVILTLDGRIKGGPDRAHTLLRYIAARR